MLLEVKRNANRQGDRQDIPLLMENLMLLVLLLEVQPLLQLLQRHGHRPVKWRHLACSVRLEGTPVQLLQLLLTMEASSVTLLLLLLLTMETSTSCGISLGLLPYAPRCQQG